VINGNPQRPARRLCWHATDNPLPTRRVRAAERTTPPPLSTPPPWLDTGDVSAPFDFCGHVRRLIADSAVRCSTLQHIRPESILVGVIQARTHLRHGLQARVTPLRFRSGQLYRLRRGVTYQVQRYFQGDLEYLYVMSFCLPRFLDQEFDDKLMTIFHELYHISPAFDGDIRRHEGRYTIHSHSQKKYDRHMTDLAREYLQGKPDPNLHAFLRLNFAQLEDRHGAVAGIVVPRPKMIPVQIGATS
jgi:predicted metallopeptidase